MCLLLPRLSALSTVPWVIKQPKTLMSVNRLVYSCSSVKSMDFWKILMGKSEMFEMYVLERTLNGRACFFKVVFYHLLDFSKRRTWAIVIDFQLIEKTVVSLSLSSIFLIYSTTFNFLLIDCSFPFQLSERFLTYTTLVNGSTYIRAAQSAPVHLNDIGEMVGFFFLVLWNCILLSQRLFLASQN